jgi:predicted nucleotidyltransferase
MTVQEVEKQGILIYKVIRGSHAYGTNLPSSDTDYSGIYLQSLDDILGFGYRDQVNDSKNDIVYYEIRRFLELLASNNPTVLELLNISEDCIVYKHPVMDMILENKEKFITKNCRNSFGGYARQQISKAQGLNKKMNWEQSQVTRKGPLDFCYVIEGQKTIPLIDFLKQNEIDQKYCGLSKIPHARDMYALFFDSNLESSIGFRGIVVENSNKIRLSNIPKDMQHTCIFYYNEDGYSMHCRKYKEYEEWLKNRNTQRYVEIENHQQSIDGKNMMHTRRLLDMAKEIALGQGINVRRPNADFLISIRQGKVNLEDLIQHAEDEIKEIDKLYIESNLPDNVDMNFVNDLLIEIRKHFYLLEYVKIQDQLVIEAREKEA